MRTRRTRRGSQVHSLSRSLGLLTGSIAFFGSRGRGDRRTEDVQLQRSISVTVSHPPVVAAETNPDLGTTHGRFRNGRRGGRIKHQRFCVGDAVDGAPDTFDVVTQRRDGRFRARDCA